MIWYRKRILTFTSWTIKTLKAFTYHVAIDQSANSIIQASESLTFGSFMLKELYLILPIRYCIFLVHSSTSIYNSLVQLVEISAYFNFFFFLGGGSCYSVFIFFVVFCVPVSLLYGLFSFPPNYDFECSIMR